MSSVTSLVTFSNSEKMNEDKSSNWDKSRFLIADLIVLIVDIIYTSSLCVYYTTYGVGSQGVFEINVYISIQRSNRAKGKKRLSQKAAFSLCFFT
jgi:hypothetical protein